MINLALLQTFEIQCDDDAVVSGVYIHWGTRRRIFGLKPQRESTGYRFGHSCPVRVKIGIPVPGIDFHGCLSE